MYNLAIYFTFTVAALLVADGGVVFHAQACDSSSTVHFSCNTDLLESDNIYYAIYPAFERAVVDVLSRVTALDGKTINGTSAVSLERTTSVHVDASSETWQTATDVYTMASCHFAPTATVNALACKECLERATELANEHCYRRRGVRVSVSVDEVRRINGRANGVDGSNANRAHAVPLCDVRYELYKF